MSLVLRAQERARDDARRIHQDQRGAVMLTGLCMSCFLIGGLWFLIGIGDTLLFRDRMQEATDHAAFTSAALHAKGMNFISMMNLLLMVLFIVHLLFGIVHDIALAVCILSVGIGCGFWLGARRAWTTYHRFMKPVAIGIHYTSYAASYGYPILATAKGYLLGKDYGEYGPKKREVTILPISTSLMPGQLVSAAVNSAFSQGSALRSETSRAKLGLPVMMKPNQAVCRKIATSGLDGLIRLTGQSPDGSVMRVVKRIIGATLELRYCNALGTGSSELSAEVARGNEQVERENEQIERENRRRRERGQTERGRLERAETGGSGNGAPGTRRGRFDTGTMFIDPGFDTFWGFEGPIVPWNGTANGSPFQHVWALNFRPTVDDEHARRVGFAQRKYDLGTQPKAPIFVSQAEFYFDCANEWLTSECNYDDNAGYAIKWRARLRRVAFPEVSRLLGGFGFEFLAQLGGVRDFRRMLGDRTGGLFGGNQFGRSITDGLLEDFVENPARGAIDGQLGEIDRAIQGRVNEAFGGMYH